MQSASCEARRVDSPTESFRGMPADVGHRKLSLKTIARRLALQAFGAKEKLSSDAGILLTFDDGPDPNITPAVLDLLAKFETKAVFFIVGNRIPRAPHMLSRILADGHLIGNHTHQHPLDKTPAFFEYYRDVDRCQKEIEDRTGISPMLFRPPRGSVTLGSLLAPRLIGLQTLFWSLYTRDWTLRDKSTASELGRRLSAIARPDDIALFHDDNPCLVHLLRNFLPRLIERQCCLISGEQLKAELPSHRLKVARD